MIPGILYVTKEQYRNGLAAFVYGVGALLSAITLKRFATHNGIYANGIVANVRIYPWADLHSWKRRDDACRVWKKSGLSLDYPVRSDTVDIAELLTKNVGQPRDH